MKPESTPAADPRARSGEIPATLRPVLTDPDRPILLLVAAGDDRSSGRAAVRLAAFRARSGRETVLADGAMLDPSLHDIVGVPNLEGLADVFLFGASLGRVRIRPDGQPFDFVPTGAYVPDPAAVLDSSGWDRVAGELTAADSLLLLFVPADTPGLGALSRRIARAVVVASDEQVDRAQDRLDPRCEVLGVLDPRALESGIPGGGEDLVAVGLGAEPDETGDGTELAEPVVFRSESVRKRLVSPLLLVLFIIVVIAGGVYLYQEYLGTPGRQATPTAGEVSEPSTPVVRGEPIETPIPVSVAVEAHPDLESARERVDALRQAEPGLQFYLAPVAVEGVLYYRLFAGPVTDQESGQALLQRLVDADLKTGADSWAVRATTLAFALGDYDTRGAARAKVDSLAVQDIPTYIVRIRFQTGPPRFRVYGGAYENQAEAEVMKEMLDDAGVEYRLVPRTGEPAA